MTATLEHTGPAGENWARSYAFRATALDHPTSLEEVQDLVSSSTAIRALGSAHSFTDLADSPGTLVTLDRMPSTITIDADAGTATIPAGLRYGDAAAFLHSAGWALHNLASLPHISVAGTVATGTHGSGDRNSTLASAVAALEIVTANGDVIHLSRGDADFDGAVVSLGALGVVTAVTLDIQPTFDVRQDLYDDLTWDDLLANFDTVTSSAYSVSVFTTWAGDTIPLVWTKSRMDAPEPPTTLLSATRQAVGRHMLPDQPATNTTEQGGVPGPWSDRLAHFKLGFTPSNGDELQSEFLVPRANAIEAIEAIRSMAHLITPHLLVTELRTMTADSLWLSGAYETDAVGIHFTWKKLPTEVAAVLPLIEERLLPLGARPHWGKVFMATDLAGLYPRYADFRSLAARMDPTGKFRNEFLTRVGL
jgi:xylitol oxidase